MAGTPIVFTVLALAGLALHGDEAPQGAPKPAAKAAVKAASAMEGVRWGVQAGLAFPTTKTFRYFSDHGTGFVIGGQATWDWTLDKRWRARLDYTAFPKVSVQSLSAIRTKENTGITGLTGGIDYLYFWGGRPEGFYTAVGATLAHWTQDASATGSKSDTSLGLAAGLGWQFNRSFGMEVRGTWSRWETNIEPRTIHNAGTLNLEGSYRF